MKRRHIVVSLGVIAALAVVVPVLASGGLSPPTKKAIKKEVAKQIAKLPLPPGPEGKQGPPGATGTPDTSKFFDKTESDARYVQFNAGGSPAAAVYTRHIVLSNTGAYATVLTLPGGFEVQCASNDSTQGFAKIESSSNFVGSLQYTTTTAGYTENTGVKKGASIAVFGSAVFGTAHFQIMDTDGTTPASRVLTITVTVMRNSVGGGVSGGPHCLAEAIVGPA